MPTSVQTDGNFSERHCHSRNHCRACCQKQLGKNNEGVEPVLLTSGNKRLFDLNPDKNIPSRDIQVGYCLHNIYLVIN